jgi:ankyrin repeat protein
METNKLVSSSCTLLEALSLNDVALARKIVQNPNRKHSGEVCYKEYEPVYCVGEEEEEEEKEHDNIDTDNKNKNKSNDSNNKIISLEELLLSAKKKTKNTALHIAAFSGEALFLQTCLEELKKKNYSKEKIQSITNCLNASNDTPLLHAASKGHFECVRLLCEMGHADVRHRNKDGLDALMASCAMDTTTTTTTRKKKNNDNTPATTTTTTTTTMTEYLFEKGADIETTDVRGRRALHYAVASENIRAVEFLLNEAKVNAAWKDSFGRTALDECVNSSTGGSSNGGNAVTNPELMEMLRKGMEKSKRVQEELFLKMLEEEEEREEQEKRKMEKKKKKKNKKKNKEQHEGEEEREKQNGESENNSDVDDDREEKEEEEEEEEGEENKEETKTSSAWTKNANDTAASLFEDDSSFEVVTSKKKKQQQQKVKTHNDQSSFSHPTPRPPPPRPPPPIPPPLPSVPPPNSRNITAPPPAAATATPSTMPPWVERAMIEFEEKHPASVDLDVTLEHVLGLNLESLSASQLDVVADAHVAALEEIRKHRLRLIQKRIIEQREEENTMARASDSNN